jgi:hypothetical protein
MKLRNHLLIALAVVADGSSAYADAHAKAQQYVDQAKRLLGEAPKRSGASAANAYKTCLKDLDTAVKTDPSIESATTDTRKACSDGLAQIEAASGSASADDSKYGTQIKDGLASALAAAGKKNLEATELVDGQKAAKSCLEGLNRLGSTYERGGHVKMYDFDKSKLTLPDGAVTLNEVKKRCTDVQSQLASKKVNGCGTKELLVTQQLVSKNPDRWGEPAFSIGETYDPATCKDMPHADKIGGGARAYAAKFKSLCKGGVAIIDSDQWGDLASASDGTPFHSMGGLCWMKGMLSFKLP